MAPQPPQFPVFDVVFVHKKKQHCSPSSHYLYTMNVLSTIAIFICLWLNFGHDQTHIRNPGDTIDNPLLWTVYIKRGDIRCVHGVGLDIVVEKADTPWSKVII